MKEKKISLKSVIDRFGSEKKIDYILSMIFSMIAGVLSIIPLFLLYLLIKEFIFNKFSLSVDIVTKYAIWILLSQIVAIIVTFLSGIFSHNVAFRVEKNIRQYSIEKLLKLPIGYFETTQSGVIRRQIDDQASKTHTYIAHNVPDFLKGMMIPICILILMFYVDWRFSLLIIGLTFIGMLYLFKTMGDDMKNQMKDYVVFGENLSSSGTEYIRGIPVVKVFQQTVESFQSFYKAIMDYDKFSKRIVFGMRKGMIFATVLISSSTLILIPVTLILMRGSENPLIVFTDGIFMIVLSFLIFSSVMLIMKINQDKEVFLNSISGIENIFEKKEQEIISEDVNKEDDEGISFKNISFTYPNRKRKAIKDFDFHFDKNKSYALVGGSGSGKSTILKLMIRLYDPDSGEISINGKDIRIMSSHEIFDDIAIVFQDSSLLNNTLRENITMGMKTSDDEILDAMKKAQCMDIYERIGSLDKKIGTEGTYVSGGEAQRLSIARAFLRKRPILLLDEASAYADAENEVKITEAIEKLKKNTTTISIAHRLSSIKSSDCILFMNDGKLKDYGSHEELMKKSDEYRDLVEEYEKTVSWTIEEVK